MTVAHCTDHMWKKKLATRGNLLHLA